MRKIVRRTMQKVSTTLFIFLSKCILIVYAMPFVLGYDESYLRFVGVRLTLLISMAFLLKFAVSAELYLRVLLLDQCVITYPTCQFTKYREMCFKPLTGDCWRSLCDAGVIAIFGIANRLQLFYHVLGTQKLKASALFGGRIL